MVRFPGGRRSWGLLGAAAPPVAAPLPAGAAGSSVPQHGGDSAPGGHERSAHFRSVLQNVGGFDIMFFLKIVLLYWNDTIHPSLALLVSVPRKITKNT